MKTMHKWVSPLVSFGFILAVFFVYYYSTIEGWIVVKGDLIDLVPTGEHPYLFGPLVVLGLMAAWATKEFYLHFFQEFRKYMMSEFPAPDGPEKVFIVVVTAFLQCGAAYFWVELMRWGFQLLFNFILRFFLGVTQTVHIEITNNLMMNWWMLVVLFVGATLSEMLDRKSKSARQSS